MHQPNTATVNEAYDTLKAKGFSVAKTEYGLHVYQSSPGYDTSSKAAQERSLEKGRLSDVLGGIEQHASYRADLYSYKGITVLYGSEIPVLGNKGCGFNEAAKRTTSSEALVPDDVRKSGKVKKRLELGRG